MPPLRARPQLQRQHRGPPLPQLREKPFGRKKLSPLSSLLLLGAADAVGLVVLRRWRQAWHRGRYLRLSAMADQELHLARWVSFYRALFGITPSWWRRALHGVPAVSLEFWSRGGEVTAVCWCPARLETQLRVLLATAVPGIDVTELSESNQSSGGRAARTRMTLWRDALHAIGGRGAGGRPAKVARAVYVGVRLGYGRCCNSAL